jgi:hypothetical protein
MEAQATDQKAQTISMTEHAAHQAQIGVRILPGEPGTFWAAYQYGTMMRMPTYYLAPPTFQELQRVLWRGRVAVASYLLEPDEHHPANAWLYICTDQTYALEKLSPNGRRDVRRGLRELTIAPLTTEQLLTHGIQGFCETRHRLGLNDGTPEEFRLRFTSRASLPEHVFLGAWKDNRLAAFLSITEIDDWAEIDGSFSTDALRRYMPNDALIYSALSHYLVERKCHVVSYGTSSLQAESNTAGLHRFKTKVGFQARPVHRAFALHPFLRPFANRLTLWSVNTALRFRPGDLRLRKAGGMLASLLGNTYMLELAASGTSDE